ncbi:MAG: transglutaminase domain-containing protein [Kiritimatiellaeota bacterium]|nr:transglutaminase domain-containing protein [Kiritimatiellota bacterium]
MFRNTPHFHGRHRARVIPVFRQIGIVVLVELGVVCALWGRGDPALTLGLMIAFPVVALSGRLPMRFLPDSFRRALQVLLAAGGLWWCYGRLGRVPSDLALGETLGILLLPLLLRANQREYALAVLLAAVLAGYGGVGAPGPAYLPAALVFVVVVLLLSYASRTAGLGAPIPPAGTTGTYGSLDRGVRNRPGLFAVLHLGIFLAGWFALAVLLPQPVRPSVGLAPVSYPAWQRIEFFRFWKPRARTPEEAPGQRGPSDLTDHGTPGEAGRERGRLTPEWVGRNTISSVQGAGRAAAGQDLVFRVRCNAKFYWLARLYDVYDGQTWRTSRELERSPRAVLRRPIPRNTVGVEQNFTVEKVVSPRLFAAFRMNQIWWDPTSTQGASSIAAVPIRRTWAGATLRRGETPATPFQYTCVSAVAFRPDPQGTAVWYDPLPREHYLRLPKHAVGEQVRQLAAEITADAASDLEKATALRNYLRENYTYTLEPTAPPPGRGPLEYFLLESRRGYCIHFAEALTVMARSTGLPARVAAGYAPGNFNLVTKCFEVYEYHAHAWAQIFVQPYGWLTFDGVPPAALSLRTVPRLLGAFQDPFGDQWSLRTPELAAATMVQGGEDEVVAGARKDAEEGAVSRLVGSFFERTQEIRDAAAGPGGVPAAVRAAGAAARDALDALWKRLAGGISQWWRHAGSRVGRLVRGVTAFVRGLSPWTRGVAAFSLLLVAGLVVQKERVRRTWARIYRRYRIRRLRRELRRVYPLRTPQTVFLAAEMAGELLCLRGYRRPPGMDIGEYADWLHRRRQGIGAEYEKIAAAVRTALFSPREVADRQVEEVFQAAMRIHAALGTRFR